MKSFIEILKANLFSLAGANNYSTGDLLYVLLPENRAGKSVHTYTTAAQCLLYPPPPNRGPGDKGGGVSPVISENRACPP